MIALSARQLADLIGPLDATGPTYRELTARIRLLVLDGRITHGTRLPSERELAGAAGVSRTTTARVYAELRDADLIESRRGSGSVVTTPRSASTVSSLILDAVPGAGLPMIYSAPTAPPGMSRAFEAAAERLPSLLSTTGYLPDGLPELRQLLAQLYTDDGLPTDPDQIIVTNGAMGAISLLARTLLDRGERVVVEGITYPHGAEAFTACGGRLDPLPTGDTPWDPDALDALLAGGPHRAAYVVPDFHNPTGAVMPDDVRARFARAFERHDVVPVVDESLRQVNLDGVSLPPSIGHYSSRAILIGSTSKWFWGGLRVGWIRAPRSAVMTLLQARMVDDLGTSAFDQLVVAQLLTDGGQTAAAGRARARSARDHLLGELAHHLPELAVTCPPGGLNLWVTLPERMSTHVVDAADHEGLVLTPGTRFFTGARVAGERHLRLPYTLEPAQLTDAVQRLARAMEAVTSERTRARRADRREGIDLIA